MTQLFYIIIFCVFLDLTKIFASNFLFKILNLILIFTLNILEISSNTSYNFPWISYLSITCVSIQSSNRQIFVFGCDLNVCFFFMSEVNFSFLILCARREMGVCRRSKLNKHLGLFYVLVILCVLKAFIFFNHCLRRTLLLSPKLFYILK